jgi:hypothetical protein
VASRACRVQTQVVQMGRGWAGDCLGSGMFEVMQVGCTVDRDCAPGGDGRGYHGRMAVLRCWG